MRPIELEAWARRVIDRAMAGETQEDSRVELKSDFPEANKSARRIAGHCNAAGGSQVMWIVGVDEKACRVVPVQEDLATWWPQTSAEFVGEAPQMQELAVDYEGVAVVVLLFESSLAPFVVRNAVFGKPEGGAVAWEVPWREGTTVRSATRPQLLKLLLPLRSLPGLEVMSATCHLYPQGNERISWQVGITMYATVPMGSGVVIPQHRAHASLAIPAAAYVCELEPTLAAKQWSGGGGFATVQADERVHTVHSGDSQVIIDGPGFLRLFGSAEVDMPPTGSDNLFEELEVRASLRPVGSDDDALISVSLHPDAREPDEGRHPPALIRWKSREAPR